MDRDTRSSMGQVGKAMLIKKGTRNGGGGLRGSGAPRLLTDGKMFF